MKIAKGDVIILKSKSDFVDQDDIIQEMKHLASVFPDNDIIYLRSDLDIEIIERNNNYDTKEFKLLMGEKYEQI